MNLRTIIFGAGGHGKVVFDVARAAGVSVDCFVDDKPSERTISGVRIISSGDPAWTEMRAFRFVVAVGDNLERKRIFKMLIQQGGEPLTLVHPRATMAPSAKLAPGTVICAGTVINPEVVMGANSIVNTSASIDHDCHIGAHVHICPGVRLAGNARVGDLSFVGIGAMVLPGVRIGDGCVIGAGSIVVKDIPNHVVAYGSPARVMRTLR